MHLKQKYMFWSSMLLGLLFVFGAVSVWQLHAIWQSAHTATAEYEAMDRADAVSNQVAWLRDALRGTDGQTYRDPKYFVPIQKEISEVVRQLEWAALVDEGDASAERDLANAVTDHLNEATKQTAANTGDSTAGATTKAAAQLELTRRSLASIAKLTPSAARRHVSVATDRISERLTWTIAWLLFVLAISAAIHFRQYRVLVSPLLWLRDEMHHSAARGYKELIEPRGDREFQDVASCFNGLAKEMADLYRSLEDKVIARSRELVRSERLASVGYLAAGVAHEINNPLSVISGYAELAAKSLHRVLNGPAGAGDDNAEAEAEAEADALASALEAQEIMRDEAFRCKEITSRLLSLARGGEDGRESLCLDELARQVTILTKGLKNYRGRRVVLDFKRSEDMEVVANPTEMKQIFLNLAVNALEAVPGERGEVRIGGQRSGDWVELFVEDNGKGMSAETIDRVFEPFYTAKRGSGDPGTGLGLSITHAIVENHGGGIRAESAGPGRGSRFTVRLPALKKVPA